MFNAAGITGAAALPDRTVVLTYDDGPGPNTLLIAEYLWSEGIAATFFVIGKHARQRQEVIVRVRGLGHRLGNHTWSHVPPGLPDRLAQGDDIVEELRSTAALLGADVGPIAFRAPYGAWTPAVATVLNSDPALASAHVGPIDWDVEGRDWEEWRAGRSPAHVAERYLAEIRAKGRGIVLMHDSSADGPEYVAGNRTYELTRALIPMLIAEGFAFAPLEAIPSL